MDSQMIGRIMTIALLSWIQETYEYDADHWSRLANITTMSLLNIEECDIPLQRDEQDSKIYTTRLN